MSLDRRSIKKEAKALIKGKEIWLGVAAMLITFVTSLIGWLLAIPITFVGEIIGNIISNVGPEVVGDLVKVIFSLISAFMTCTGVSIGIIVMIRLNMGVYRNGDIDFGEAMQALKGGNLGLCIITSLRVSISVGLWSCLFIVPGILKMYSYMLVPYILSEKPDMSSKAIMEASKSIMDGHRFEWFVMTLSFMLWLMLNTLTCGLASFYTLPYMNMTQALYYSRLALDESDNE